MSLPIWVVFVVMISIAAGYGIAKFEEWSVNDECPSETRTNKRMNVQALPEQIRESEKTDSLGVKRGKRQVTEFARPAQKIHYRD